MSKGSAARTEAELAERYNQTRDLSGFERGVVEPVEVRRNITISVRFSEDEIELLRSRAEAAGDKVTAYIRAAALQQDAPVDRGQVLGLLKQAEDDVARASRLLSGRP